MRALAIALLTVLALGGGITYLALGGWRTLSWQAEDGASLQAPISAVEIAGGNGRVTIEVADVEGIEIHRAAYHLLPGLDPLREAGHHVDGDVLHLEPNCDGPFCVVELTVQVPAPLPVSGNVGSGSVHLVGLGTTDLTASSGGITIVDPQGPVTARAGSGSVTIRDARGVAIDVETSSGHIAIDQLTSGDIWARATSGSIRATVADAPFQVSIDTTGGRVATTVDHDATASHSIDLATTTGHVRLSRS